MSSVRGGSTRGRGRGSAPFAQSGAIRGTSNPHGRSGHNPSRRGNGTPRGSLGQPSQPNGGPHANAPNAPSHGRNPSSTSTGRSAKSSWQDRHATLKVQREKERADAIRLGLMADPEKPRSLAHAITPVGTCQDMCPEFERVTRVVHNEVWAEETVGWVCAQGNEVDVTVSDQGQQNPNHSAFARGEAEPIESRMVKKFRRSAAGNDEQLPSDLRPPLALKRTCDYLFNDVIANAPSLSKVHHFVWDRTRAIRNDFSIQQLTKPDDLRIAIECYERIARFHIVSLHLLALPDKPYAKYDAQQEREQLDRTLLSLMQYYDDTRGRMQLANEAEFRTYCVIFQLRDPTPDLEDRIQSWPRNLIHHPRVETAVEIYSAACNVTDPQGPLKPPTAHLIARQDWERFWQLIASPGVSYLMACVAEIYFPLVRRMALRAIVRASGKRAASAAPEWSVDDLWDFFNFDEENELIAFVERFGFAWRTRAEDGQLCLDLNSVAGKTLPEPSGAGTLTQLKSSLVEGKRHGRTVPAVINGLNVRQAQESGLIVEEEEEVEEKEFDVNDEIENQEAAGVEDDDDSLFLPEAKPPIENAAQGSSGQPAKSTPESTAFGKPSGFNFGKPSAGTFGSPSQPALGPSPQSTFDQPSQPTFGQPSRSPFAQPSQSTSSKTSQSPLGQRSPSPFGQKSNATGFTAAPDPGATTLPKEPKPTQSSSPFTAGPNQTKAPSSSPFNFLGTAQEANRTASGGTGFQFSPSLGPGASSPVPKAAPEPVHKPSAFTFPSSETTSSFQFTSLQNTHAGTEISPSKEKAASSNHGASAFQFPSARPDTSQTSPHNATTANHPFSLASEAAKAPAREKAPSIPTQSEISNQPSTSANPAPSLFTSSETTKPTQPAPSSNWSSSNHPASSVQNSPAMTVNGQNSSSASANGQALKRQLGTDWKPKTPSKLSSSFTVGDVSGTSDHKPPLSHTGPGGASQSPPVTTKPDTTPPPAPAVDTDAILSRIAYEIMMDPISGLLKQYVDHHVGKVITQVQDQIYSERVNQEADDFRQFCLSFRYGRKWRDICRHRRMAKQARERRRRAERRLKEAEATASQDGGSVLDIASTLGSSRASSVSTSRPQSKHELSQREQVDRKFQEMHNAGAFSRLDFIQSRSKRMAEAHDDNGSFSNGVAEPRHKRQKSNDLNPSPGPQQPSNSSPGNQSLFLGSSIANFTRGRANTMKSSYFRIKAMGLKPHSDFGASSRGTKRPRSESLDAVSDSSARSIETHPPRLRLASSRSDPPPGPSGQQRATSSSSAANADDEALFARLRAARESLKQTEELMKAEQLRRSHPSGGSGAVAVMDSTESPSMERTRQAVRSRAPSATDRGYGDVPAYRLRESRFVGPDSYRAAVERANEMRASRSRETSRPPPPAAAAMSLSPTHPDQTWTTPTPGPNGTASKLGDRSDHTIAPAQIPHALAHSLGTWSSAGDGSGGNAGFGLQGPLADPASPTDDATHESAPATPHQNGYADYEDDGDDEDGDLEDGDLEDFDDDDDDDDDEADDSPDDDDADGHHLDHRAVPHKSLTSSFTATAGETADDAIELSD